MPETKVVCVVNNYDIFNSVVKNNENLKNCEIIDYDNTTENIPITKRYNDLIDNNINENSDFWVAFIHQDFGFRENLNSLLKKMDKKHIYGAVGATLHKGLFIGKEGFKTSIALIWGRILQGNNDFNFKKYGLPIIVPITADAIDCCCIMMHSSLIAKHHLRFDENLSFHMYAEELCYRVKKEYKVKTKVIQTKCFHLGKGSLNEEFQKSAQYLKEKFKIKRIPSTCKN